MLKYTYSSHRMIAAKETKSKKHSLSKHHKLKKH